MSNELIREKIILDQKIGKETTQVLMEGDIIVPDIKPDMAVMLQTDARVTIDRSELSADRVNFMGKLDIQVLYLAKGSEKPVHNMNVSTAIDDFVNMDGITKDMWAEVSADITNIDYKMLNDRKINYRAVVDVTVVGECSNSHDVIVDIEGIPSNQLQKANLIVNRSIENKSDRFVIKDELAIPSGKPNIREILQTTATVSNKEVRVGNGKVTVNGELLITTLYKGDSDSSLIEFTEHEMPFNGQVDVHHAKDGMIADVKLNAQDVYVQVRPDEDGEDRVLEIEISVGVLAKVHCQDTLEILEDAYCINKALDITRDTIKYPKLICRNKNQSPVKEVVQLTGSCPDILQIFRVKGKPCVDEIKIIDDKVVAEGVIEADILYVAEDDDMPLYSYKTAVPFHQVIETKGAQPDMEVSMEASIDHVGFNMLSGREMELRFLLSFNTQVVEEKESGMITDIEFNEMDKDFLDTMSSMTIYVVQPGDSLWKIAKRYNTSIDDLLSVNDIENPAKIYPGQKLLILKKVVA